MATPKGGKSMAKSSMHANHPETKVSFLSSPPHAYFPIAPRTPPKPPRRRSLGFSNLVNETLKSKTKEPKQGVRLRKKTLRDSPAIVNSTDTIPKQDQSGGGLPTAVLDAHIQSISLAVVPDGIIDKQVWGDGSELQSSWNMAVEKLYGRPKFGETYEAITVDVERIKKRLKDLSMNAGEVETKNKNTIDEGIEISDAVALLKFKSTSSSKIEMAGQKAQRAAALMLQAQMMSNKANELLAQCKQILQSADL